MTLVVQDTTQPLQNIVALQQLLWAISDSQREHLLKVKTFGLTAFPLAVAPYVIRVQRQWLESAWRDGRVQVCTPSLSLSFGFSLVEMQDEYVLDLPVATKNAVAIW